MKIARTSRVELLDSMGSDVTVVNAARVSFAKSVSEMRPADEGLIRYLATGLRAKERLDLVADIVDCETSEDAPEIVRRIRHTAVHWAPMAHIMAQFRIAAPLFVARQLWKSHIGLANQDENLGWSEVSRRYVDYEPEFFLPEGGFRARADDVKQGSANTQVPGSEWLAKTYFRVSANVYRLALGYGWAPEDARTLLPSALMTEWIWTGSVMSFARICSQRLDGHAQSYTRDVAQQISDLLALRFPVTWKALME